MTWVVLCERCWSNHRACLWCELVVVLVVQSAYTLAQPHSGVVHWWRMEMLRSLEAHVRTNTYIRLRSTCAPLSTTMNIDGVTLCRIWRYSKIRMFIDFVVQWDTRWGVNELWNFLSISFWMWFGKNSFNFISFHFKFSKTLWNPFKNNFCQSEFGSPTELFRNRKSKIYFRIHGSNFRSNNGKCSNFITPISIYVIWLRNNIIWYEHLLFKIEITAFIKTVQNLTRNQSTITPYSNLLEFWLI